MFYTVIKLDGHFSSVFKCPSSFITVKNMA
jgi:hypothetical protein